MNQALAKRPAGLMRRLAAMAYDWLLLASLLFGATLVIIIARGGRPIEPGTWWYSALLIFTAFLFYGWCWTHGGQTLGLRAWKLRVTTAEGGPLTWPDAARRFAAGASLLVPPGLGLIWSVFDAEKRCWNDRLSRTRVVKISG